MRKEKWKAARDPANAFQGPGATLHPRGAPQASLWEPSISLPSDFHSLSFSVGVRIFTSCLNPYWDKTVSKGLLLLGSREE